MPDNTEKIQKKIRFQKGQSGNPSGRPQGSRNKASLMAEQLFIDDLKGICESVIEQAKLGNMQAAKIILDRLLPPRKDYPISIELPQIESSADILKAIGCITRAIAFGNITPSEGDALAKVLDTHAKSLELFEFEKRLSYLEEQKGSY